MGLTNSYPGPSGEELCAAFAEAKSRGISRMQLARELGMSYAVMTGRYNAYKKNIKDDEYPFGFDMGKPWVFEWDNCIITGDVHLPFTDLDFARFPALIAEKHLEHPRRLIVAGDFFNMDVFSSFPQIISLPSWQQERDAAIIFIKMWLETFDEIYMLMGNHERRLQRFTIGAMNEDDILALIKAPKKKVKMSGFAYCILKCKETGDWKVTHPRNYVQREGSVVNKLAQMKRMNIIGFHQHHTGIAVDDSGYNIIVDVGGLADGNKFPYIALEDNTKPSMKKSFLMMKDGYPYLFGDGLFTDWDFWLKSKA